MMQVSIFPGPWLVKAVAQKRYHIPSASQSGFFSFFAPRRKNEEKKVFPALISRPEAQNDLLGSSFCWVWWSLTTTRISSGVNPFFAQKRKRIHHAGRLQTKCSRRRFQKHFQTSKSSL
jgi:hypothetical protein